MNVLFESHLRNSVASEKMNSTITPWVLTQHNTTTFTYALYAGYSHSGLGMARVSSQGLNS